MTNLLYGQAHTPDDGLFYPIHPEFHNFSSTGHRAAVATDQPPLGFSATCETGGGNPPGWDYGQGDVKLPFPPHLLGTVHGEGQGLHPQAPWKCGAKADMALMVGTMELADPMAQYVPVEESIGGCDDSLKWPTPPLGRSRDYASPPASRGGAGFSRHNSCPSLPAPRAPAIEQTQFDGQSHSVTDQRFYPDEGRLAPAGIVAANGANTSTESASSAGHRTGPQTDGQNQETTTTTTTTYYNAGTMSPVMAPSSKDSTPAVPNQVVSRSASKQRPREITGTKALPAAWRTAQQELAAPPETAGRGLGQQSQSNPQSRSQSQSQSQSQPGLRTRNRDAAYKCRAKTRLAVAELESAERVKSSEHRDLSATAQRLRAEVLMLKNALIAHGNCGDSFIQQYLTNQARMIVSSATQHHEHQHRQRQQQQQRHHIQ